MDIKALSMDIETFDDHVRGFVQSDLARRDLIANFALGLAGESGEVADLIKKHLYHGDDLDREKFVKEMGDVLFYWFALLQQFSILPEEVMHQNIEKLQAQHGGTTFNRAVQRINKALETEVDA